MFNPFRSEAEAYRLLLLTVGAFLVIVVAKVAFGTEAAVVALGVVAASVVAWYVRARSAERAPPTAPARRGAEDERRILVIANETVAGEALRERIAQRSEGVRERVLVVCPALNTRLRHWASDEDRARAEAQDRLDRSLAQLAAVGVDARGEVGDAEPLQAIEDACRTFGPDEIIISTHPEGRSNWLERRIVDRARERFDCPITHVVVDLAAERHDGR